MKTFKLSIYTLTAIGLLGSHVAYAEQLMSAPTLEGGVSAMIGTFYAQTSTENTSYAFDAALNDTGDGLNASVANVTPDYDFGIEAALGYVFEDTANGIELSYRNLSTDGSNTSQGTFDAGSGMPFAIAESTGHVNFDLNTADLMISQFMDIGDQMQMRFVGGLSYLSLEQKTNTDNDFSFIPDDADNVPTQGEFKSDFTGWGPRLGIDARYDFGQGFGIVGGGSVAYYLGELNINSTQGQLNFDGQGGSSPFIIDIENDVDSHNITNLRGNLGIDYVYFFDNEERSTLGLELGYQVDYYDDAVALLPAPTIILPSNVTFSGPYLNLKGVF